jgi:hypothetical protein
MSASASTAGPTRTTGRRETASKAAAHEPT